MNTLGPKDEEYTLRLLTFNTWGLKYVSKFRKERLRALAQKLSEENSDNAYDIVALQEVWCEEDWEYIDASCSSNYPYRRRFMSGIVAGPGLAILSKIPIKSTFLYRFPINGRASAFFRGDWYVGKSIGVTILQPEHKGAVPLAVLNSHMHAPYGQIGDRAYACHRACQAWDISNIVSVLKDSGFAVALVGDLNSKEGSLPYRLFTIGSGLADSWEMCHHDDAEYRLDKETIACMNPEEQITYGGITCDSQLNTWRSQRKRWEACRLDYALIDSSLLKPLEASVKFTELLDAPMSCSYSDHFAYYVKLAMVKRPQVAPVNPSKISLIKELISEIQLYQSHTIPFQSGWRKLHFFVSIVCVVAILIGIRFVPKGTRWASVLLALAAVLIAVSGTLNGLIWYLGVRSESRALAEVQMEAEDYLASISSPTKK